MANSIDLDDVQAFAFNLQMSLTCVADLLHEIQRENLRTSDVHSLDRSQGIVAMVTDACIKLQDDIEAQFNAQRSEKAK
ncbi:MAG: hypothetical protein IBJ07_12180 [Rhizobiaceae bacterium]|nr:hypothetical protein [Rhizobiaceae bacterium]